MASYKRLLVGARVVKAGRKRRCFHSKGHVVVKGDVVLEVKDGMNWKGYCSDCANQMLSRADTQLKDLRAGIEAGQANAS